MTVKLSPLDSLCSVQSRLRKYAELGPGGVVSIVSEHVVSTCTGAHMFGPLMPLPGPGIDGWKGICAGDVNVNGLEDVSQKMVHSVEAYVPKHARRAGSLILVRGPGPHAPVGRYNRSLDVRCMPWLTWRQR